MPRFDGTGPRGAGPLTGRGQGYCVMALPSSGRPAVGYAGLQGMPVRGTAAAYGDYHPAYSIPASPAYAYGRGRPRRGLGRGRGWR